MRKSAIILLFAFTAALPLAAFDGDAPKAKEKTKIIVNGKTIVDQDDDDNFFVFTPGDAMRGGYLGVNLVELTPELRAHFGVPADNGVMVSKVEPGSPADKAGLKAGDIITSVDGQPVRTSWSIGRTVRQKKEGDQVKVEFTRNGARQQAFASVAVRERPILEGHPPFFKGELPDGKRIVINGIPGEELEKIETYFNSPEWKTKVEAMSKARVDAGMDCARVQTKMKELEKKMQELEKKLNAK